MNTLRLLLLLIFLLVIVMVFQTGFLPKNIPTEKNVLQEKVHQDYSLTPTQTKIPSPSPTNAETISFLYPSAQLSEKTDISETYISTDDPEKVTDWYKNKIVSGGFSIKTFVRTKANDKVENVLAGSSNNKQIRIEILKKDKNFPTIITVVR